MSAAQPNLFTRDDTFFGVCEAIGQDFRINPNWLRAAFAVPLIYSPVMTMTAYAVMGVIVAFSRLVVRRPKAADGKADTMAVLETSTMRSAASSDDDAFIAEPTYAKAA